jgi:tRNA(fMet)-specific endonuclease VapC
VTVPRFLLDTNILIYLRRNRPAPLVARIRALAPGDAAVSAITFGELQFGAHKSSDPETSLAALEALCAGLLVLDIPLEAARHYGRIRGDFERRGEIIGGNDLWIAAHALAEDLTLVTNNEREFSRVSGLRVENWVEPAR